MQPSSAPQQPKAVPVPQPPAAAAPPAQKEPEKPPVITNYWQHINEILATEAARRTRYDLKTKTKYPPPRSFPFDAFNHLKAKDLLRAVDESIQNVRMKPGGRPEEEIDHQIEVNINTCLEYYPLLASEDSDFTNILYRIQGSDPALQTYLIKRIVPGLADKSLFSDYLQDRVRRERTDIQNALTKICGDIMANEKVQRAAFETEYALLLEEYLDVFRKDPAVVAYKQQNGKEASPKLLLEPGILTVSPDTLTALEQLSKGFHEYTTALAANLNPANARSVELRKEVRNWIDKVYTGLYLKDREAIKTILDQYPEDSLK